MRRKEERKMPWWGRVENSGRRRDRPTFKVVDFGGDLLMHEIDGTQGLWKKYQEENGEVGVRCGPGRGEEETGEVGDLPPHGTVLRILPCTMWFWGPCRAR